MRGPLAVTSVRTVVAGVRLDLTGFPSRDATFRFVGGGAPSKTTAAPPQPDTLTFKFGPAVI